MNGCAILTYHSQNIEGHGTADNDHVALAADLERLFDAGVPVVPLAWVADWLDGERPAADGGARLLRVPLRAAGALRVHPVSSQPQATVSMRAPSPDSMA